MTRSTLQPGPPSPLPERECGRPGPASIPDERFPWIAREGWPIVAIFAIVSAGIVGGLAWLWGAGAAWTGAVVCGLLTGWCVWFFRDPQRRIPAAPGLVLAPADGVVCFVGAAQLPPELGLDVGEGLIRVSVFMNVFNVHVNRCPAQAVVGAVHYRPGRFFNASFDKASEHNERCSLRLMLPDGRTMACVQIAGLVARRIVCRVRAGDALRAGQRFGLIRFGSRVDVYLPRGSAPLVTVGQRSVAGETILAHLGAPGGPQT